MQMARDFKIHKQPASQGYESVLVVGETPDAMQRGRNTYFRKYPTRVFCTDTDFETSQTCKITRQRKPQC